MVRHDPERWEEFQKRYREELRHKKDLIDEINRSREDEGSLTLLYSAKDEEHNNAIVLLKVLRDVE